MGWCMCLEEQCSSIRGNQDSLNYTFEQRGNRCLQLLGDYHNCSQSNVGPAAFDFSHVASVQPTIIGELFLRPPLLQSQFTNPGA